MKADQLNDAGVCLRLFLSVDVSGSTAYKEKHGSYPDIERHWQPFYEEFFTRFPSSFAASFFETGRGYPRIWKCLGDELIFEDKMKDEADCHQVISLFYSALLDYDRYLQTGDYAGSGLRVKATCWTAGFPLRNSIITLADGSSDYIGPDIDLGFRLSKATRPGRLTISMDLADILTRNAHEDPFDFYHVGWEHLKGVIGGNPYPIFWILKKEDASVLLPYVCSLSNQEESQKLISKVRKALPSCGLFPPYFDEVQMPGEHKLFYDKWFERYSLNREILRSEKQLRSDEEA